MRLAEFLWAQLETVAGGVGLGVELEGALEPGAALSANAAAPDTPNTRVVRFALRRIACAYMSSNC